MKVTKMLTYGRYFRTEICGHFTWRNNKMENNQIEKPEFLNEKHLVYLDKLRESGVTNMFGAGVYVQKFFKLSRDDAKQILIYWMKTFSARHKK